MGGRGSQSGSLSFCLPRQARLNAHFSPEWCLKCDSAFVAAMQAAGYRPVAGFKRATPLIEKPSKRKRASTEADAKERKQPIVVRLMVTTSGPPLPSLVPPWNRRSPVLRGRGFSSRCSIKTKFKNGQRLTWFRSYPFPHGFLPLWAKKGALTEADVVL
jgi:hypothetical protein